MFRISHKKLDEIKTRAYERGRRKGAAEERHRITELVFTAVEQSDVTAAIVQAIWERDDGDS